MLFCWIKLKMSFYQPRGTYIDPRFHKKRRKRRPPSRKRTRSRSRSRSRVQRKIKRVNAFRIKSIKQTRTASVFKDLDKRIPYPTSGGFRTLVIGNSGSGKTVLMISLLNEYQPFFDGGIHVFSPAPAQYEKNMNLSSRDTVTKPFDEEKMVQIYERHKENNRRRGRIGYMLFVIDDYVLMLNRAKSFQKLLLNGRKHGVSFLISSQRYQESSALIKANMTNQVILTGTERDLRGISSYIGLNPKELISVFRKYVRPYQYSFLHIKSYPLSVYLRFSKTKLIPKTSKKSRSRRRTKNRKKRSRRR